AQGQPSRGCQAPGNTPRAGGGSAWGGEATRARLRRSGVALWYDAPPASSGKRAFDERQAGRAPAGRAQASALVRGSPARRPGGRAETAGRAEEDRATDVRGDPRVRARGVRAAQAAAAGQEPASAVEGRADGAQRRSQAVGG